MNKNKLVEKQLELQQDAVKIIEEKLMEQHSKLSASEQETFKKVYLHKITKSIIDIKKENLSTAIAKILKEKYDFKEQIKKNISDFEDMEDFQRLQKAIDKDNLKEYLIEDISKYLSFNIIDMIENKQPIPQNSIFKYLYNFLFEYLIDFDSTIKKYKLQQKQALSLFTLYLKSNEIAFLIFIALSKLLVVKESDEEDKVTPNSEQQLIKEISEEIFNSVESKIKQKFNIIIEEPSNKNLIEMTSELFILFEYFDVIEKQDKDNEYDLYDFSNDFKKNSKNFLDNIIKYTPPFFEPMVVPPVEWKSINDGGYLKDDNSSTKYNLFIQKIKDKKDRNFVLSQKDSISKDFLKAINILQSTKWTINKKVLKQAKKYIDKELKNIKKEFNLAKKENKHIIKNINETIKKLQEDKNRLLIEKSTLKKYGIVDKIEDLDKNIKSINKELYSLINKKKSLFKEFENREQKLRISQKIIEIATKFKYFDNIYFTWQVDFRGRVYPVQALLNPQGDDLSKALLTFADKKPLGKNGDFWLKVHGANCYGNDKVSFDDRVKWIEKNEKEILKIASSDNPFEIDFLQNANDKFRFLAFCYEYSEYKKDRTNFKSSLPIALDGSNNGFQHISALLKDTEGAKKVNVLPNQEDRPADIYKEVANQLKKSLKKDIENVKYKDDILKILNHIDRNFVKKGVMTDSYGASQKAKAIQIKNFIEDNLAKKENFITNLADLSNELAKYLNKTIDTIAPSSSKYKIWIKDIAKKISIQNREIVWETPYIGFKVRQAIYKTKEERVVTAFKNKKNIVQIRVTLDDIDKNEQIKGIAPNFIHSLDATHLYMTILSCYNNAISSFATVHDSFATHACDVETLAQILKSEFIKLHKLDILKNFQEYIANNYGLEIVEKYDKVKRNNQIKDIKTIYVDSDFDIEKLKNSKYFFA